MNRLCNCSSGGTGLALLVSLAMGSWAYGQCSNDAGAGDLAEGEACYVDNDVDTTNPGCNADPSVFITLTAGDFTAGEARICGVSSTYLNNASCTTDADCDPGETCVSGGCTGGDEPSVSTRDTDWYLIPQSVLTAHDVDLNGVVQLNSEYVGSEAPMPNFHIGITPNGTTCDSDILSDIGCVALAGDACDVDADCHSGNCVGDPVPGDGNPQGTCAAENDPANNTLVIADYPDGIAVWTGIGFCSGGGDWGNPDYFCSTGNNDYVLRIWFTEAPTACQPGPPQGPCNEAAGPGVPGCEDPNCCALVCGTPGLAFCCSSGWFQSCATAAIDLGCAPEPGGPVLIRTGDDPTVEGYLQVKTDPYGAFSDPSFGGTPGGSDNFNPNSAGDDMAIASFANGFFIFMRDTNSRELLANLVDWQEVFAPDDSLDREITSINLPSDTSGDGEFDQLVSQFRVTGPGVDMTFNVQQNVKLEEPGISTLKQKYLITNNLASPIDFIMQRNMDGDLVWQGSTFSNDSVGTGTNGSASDRHVFTQEPGVAATAITLSSPLGNHYVGAKSGDNPDPPDCVAMGAGTDVQDWDAYGLPVCWENYISNVGYGLNGTSGGAPGTDAHITLAVEVSLPAGPGPAVEVNFLQTYGQQTPYGQEGEPCPWDCQPVPNGDVDVPDFLAILAQWGDVGTSCDFGSGDPGVGINEFLDFLANFGP
ncbi:MAG: hypothetical protein ACYSU7_18195, partial [Planctomycetota bacterium]